ncbi:9881_t:CDS:2 [Acaulospora colombiana]|uniref:9881_t:CDS:1 n=1 Tax=Acaulospora colombiana TaxID=27376 RepID=A0ACA9L770_9GLOM|nr:9881_t:CDS:2 [Acaulospora colombiana]
MTKVALPNSTGGTLTYCYRWKITNWCEFYKGRQKNPQALSLYLGILETTPGCLHGIRKKVSIIFVLENLRTRGMDFGKMEFPVWFCDKHSTWGEENLMSLDEMDSNDTVSLCVKFEIQESIIDASPEIGVNPFNKLVNSPRFSDITFRVIDDAGRDKLFYAHKGVLACSSPVFEAMLTNGMKETHENEIRLHQANHNAFLALLTYVYTFNVNIESLCDAENLLALADRFAIVHVREECLRYFRLEVNVNNVWGIWAIAEKYSCSKTSTSCRDYVARYLGTLLDKQSTLDADPNILCLALENDEANVDKEEHIYEFVVKWVNYFYSSDSSNALTVSKNSSSTHVDTLSTSPSTSSSVSMPSELPEDFEDLSLMSLSERNDGVSIDQDYGDAKLLDDEVDDSEKFPKPWRGDRLAALPTLLKCVRFPLMQTRYIFEKVEKNPVIMEAEGMKDLVAYCSFYPKYFKMDSIAFIQVR